MAYNTNTIERDLEIFSIKQKLKNMMSFYMLQAWTIDNGEYLEKWAHREDCSLMMPWGCYSGYEGVVRCYQVDHGFVMDNPIDPGMTKALSGALYIHTVTTPVIEVAEDMQTARGMWWSNGTEGNGLNGGDFSLMGWGGWMWGGYCVDFIKEDGEWKIWHMIHQPRILSHFTECWNEIPPYEGFTTGDSCQDRQWEKQIYQYSVDKMHTGWDMPIPRPYKTFDDVAPGYSYGVYANV